MSDEEILEKLLALNLERAKDEQYKPLHRPTSPTSSHRVTNNELGGSTKEKSYHWIDGSKIMYQIGAILYFMWGILHLLAAVDVFKLGSGQNKGMVQGRLFQHAWNLAIIAIAAMVVAVVYNWTNNALGYWINLIIVTDISIINVPRKQPFSSVFWFQDWNIIF